MRLSDWPLIGVNMVRVAVKWQKNSYDVDVDTTEPPAVFKFQLYSLTAVPPERQKIMIKGGTLKDDTDWAKVDLKEGQKLMMMGTADKVSFSYTSITAEYCRHKLVKTAETILLPSCS